MIAIDESLRVEKSQLPVGRAIKLLVYSHDTFGLGNICRMIAICEHLKARIPGISVLLITGSPMIHSLRLVDGIDYVKLPCLRRDAAGTISTKYLKLSLDSTVRLRRELILSTVTNLRPDIFLVDKKPGGVEGELEDSLKALTTKSPETAVMLLLRDILDDGAVTVKHWKRDRTYELLQEYYDTILVAGLPELYDVREEYQLPPALRKRVRFCGYLRRDGSTENRTTIRQQLHLTDTDRMVLVTAGGGEDGYGLMRNYLHGLAARRNDACWKTVVVTGPELAELHKRELRRVADRCIDVQIIEFTDQMMNYMKAADVVVSMAGYNTVCEILSLRKRAVIVPRIRPVQEQKIRAERMARLGVFKMIHPAELTPMTLIEAVETEIEASHTLPLAPACIKLDALPRISDYVTDALMEQKNFGYCSFSAGHA